tara:strand:+ start:1242 stop:1427 length:186 start_codon:yes stop_codon:yes gene_type:complete
MHGSAADQKADHASVRRLAKKNWQEKGGVTLSYEQLECLSSGARRELVAVMEAQYGKRGRT